MIRRRMTKKKGKPYIDKVYIKASGDYTIPANCTKIDLFLVGGGGAGGKWVSWGYSPGGSGSGGGTNTIKGITVTPGQIISITIGKGGSSYSSNGGSTTVNANASSYTAPGGNGGLMSQNGNYNTDAYNYWYKLLGASASHGGSYNNSGLVATDNNGSTTHYIRNQIGTVLGSFDGSAYSTIGTVNPYVYGNGIPEFYESGLPTHAAGGCMIGALNPATSFTEGAGAKIYESYGGSDMGYWYGGGGFGGGGCGQFYGTYSVGTGGDGVVVIREYFNQ